MPQPDFEALRRVTQEATRLFNEGRLTLEKLDELEAKAEQVCGEYGEWEEKFAQYRDVLEAFAGREG